MKPKSKKAMILKIIVKRQREYLGMVMVALQFFQTWILLELFKGGTTWWIVIPSFIGVFIFWIWFIKYDYENLLGAELDISYEKSEVMMEIYKAAKKINMKERTYTDSIKQ